MKVWWPLIAFSTYGGWKRGLFFRVLNGTVWNKPMWSLYNLKCSECLCFLSDEFLYSATLGYFILAHAGRVVTAAWRWGTGTDPRSSTLGVLAWGHLGKQLHQDTVVPLMPTDKGIDGRHRSGVRLAFGSSTWWLDAGSSFHLCLPSLYPIEFLCWQMISSSMWVVRGRMWSKNHNQPALGSSWALLYTSILHWHWHHPFFLTSLKD